jgi:hypothetical protein
MYPNYRPYKIPTGFNITAACFRWHSTYINTRTAHMQRIYARARACVRRIRVSRSGIRTSAPPVETYVFVKVTFFSSHFSCSRSRSIARDLLLIAVHAHALKRNLRENRKYTWSWQRDSFGKHDDVATRSGAEDHQILDVRFQFVIRGKCGQQSSFDVPGPRCIPSGMMRWHVSRVSITLRVIELFYRCSISVREMVDNYNYHSIDSYNCPSVDRN